VSRVIQNCWRFALIIGNFTVKAPIVCSKTIEEWKFQVHIFFVHIRFSLTGLPSHRPVEYILSLFFKMMNSVEVSHLPVLAVMSCWNLWNILLPALCSSLIISILLPGQSLTLLTEYTSITELQINFQFPFTRQAIQYTVKWPTHPAYKKFMCCVTGIHHWLQFSGDWTLGPAWLVECSFTNIDFLQLLCNILRGWSLFLIIY
jgi:hypothetical protein